MRELAVAGRERLPFTLAIHRGQAKAPGQAHNPHCHLLLSERANDGLARSPQQWFRRANRQAPERGGARKVSALTSTREWLADVRQRWATIANASLERAGHAARIDERSLRDQWRGAIAASRPEAHDPAPGDWTPEQERKLAQLERKPGRHLGPAVAALQRKLQQQNRGRSTDRAKDLRAESLWEQARVRLVFRARNCLTVRFQ